MNYLNPHTHDLSGNGRRGYWVARPECIVTHDMFAAGLETAGVGYRDMPVSDGEADAIRHEHFEPIPRTMSGPAQRLPDGARVIEPPDDQNTQRVIGQLEGWEYTTVQSAESEPFGTPVRREKFQATLTISDLEDETLIYMKIQGSAHAVAQSITWAADAFKEDQER